MLVSCVTRMYIGVSAGYEYISFKFFHVLGGSIEGHIPDASVMDFRHRYFKKNEESEQYS